MFDLSTLEWIIIICSGLLIGFAKAGVASMGDISSYYFYDHISSTRICRYITSFINCW
ncbi:hypothetical protein JCM21714_4089 [Gracilibacillus boraciitolerans JCM 21714]|uniref:Uncharacterized protein n=1 Tax=Gracilibacillus boraciitolerans JCM 21714 TaxID=1298598 RepID=W4VNA4_9BACI|nr:hypothetical protein JCM21714_4089 [Gracilibacillus boraciitolerans JCM 21714]